MSARTRHVPIRSCVGCGQRAPQPDLLCLRSGAGDSLQLVGRRQRSGRSAYLHVNGECWERFAKRKGPIRSLRRAVDKHTRIALVQQLKAADSPAIVE